MINTTLCYIFRGNEVLMLPSILLNRLSPVSVVVEHVKLGEVSVVVDFRYVIAVAFGTAVTFGTGVAVTLGTAVTFGNGVAVIFGAEEIEHIFVTCAPCLEHTTV